MYTVIIILQRPGPVLCAAGRTPKKDEKEYRWQRSFHEWQYAVEGITISYRHKDIFPVFSFVHQSKSFLIVFEFILTLGQSIYAAMRKFLLFLPIILCLVIELPAQEKKTDKPRVSAGVKTGMNISRLRLDGKIAGILESDFRRGFVAGGFVNVPFGKSPFSFQPEFLYSSMGGDLINALNQKQNYRFNYFSLPLLIKYRISSKITAILGGQADMKIYAKETNIFGEFNVTNQLDEYDLYATGGLEFWPWKNIAIGGRYMHGLRDVYQIGNVTTQNRGFQLSVGLKFHKPKPWAEPVVQAPVVTPEKDTDGDGILDSKDKCPTVAGVAKYQGCPVPDTDKDGILDDKDKCPEMPGYPELDGCPYPDRDKDGVTDNKDRCPDEPGSTKNDGCPITDRDGDGVPDATDRCPDVPGPASNQGCPEVKETEIAKTAAIARSIYFDLNSDKLQQRSYEPLDELVKILNENPTYKLSIEGHTDNTGTNEYNQDLSERRSNTVKNYLTGRGIDASRLTAAGFGEERPVADNNTKEGRALNRRTELKLSN